MNNNKIATKVAALEFTKPTCVGFVIHVFLSGFYQSTFRHPTD